MRDFRRVKPAEVGLPARRCNSIIGIKQKNKRKDERKNRWDSFGENTKVSFLTYRFLGLSWPLVNLVFFETFFIKK